MLVKGGFAMKKIVVAIISLVILATSLIAWKLITYKNGEFQPNSQANFYIIYPGKIDSYKLETDQPILLESQALPEPDYLGSGTNFTLDNRHLLFSNYAHKYSNSNLVSIDFENGKILRQPSKYSTNISGTDGEFFYTASPHGVAKFDKELKHLKDAKLPEYFNPNPTIMIDDNTIYLVGTENIPDNPDNWKQLLILVDKQTMTVSETIELDKTMGLHSGYLMNNILYLPIISYTSESLEYTQSQQVLTFNTQSKSIDLIELSNPSPAKMHSLDSDSHILIEHDGYTTNDIRFTIYDTKTGDESFHVFPDVNPSYLTVSHLQSLDDERLLFIVGDQLYLYNWKTKEVLNQMSLDSDYITGIWVTK